MRAYCFSLGHAASALTDCNKWSAAQEDHPADNLTGVLLLPLLRDSDF